jgi:hypothetical protein
MLPQSLEVTLMTHVFHLAHDDERIRCVNAVALWERATLNVQPSPFLLRCAFCVALSHKERAQ